MNLVSQTMSFWSMASPQPGDGSGGGGLTGMLIPMLLIFGLFYFMLIRPQQRRESERRKMIETLRAGQRVMFAGGILGTIVEAGSHTFKVEVAQGVVVEVARGAVNRHLEAGENAVADEKS